MRICQELTHRGYESLTQAKNSYKEIHGNYAFSNYVRHLNIIVSIHIIKKTFKHKLMLKGVKQQKKKENS